MAQYTIKYSCGHTGSEQLFGSEASRKARIAAAAKHGQCAACKAASRAAEQAKSFEVANALPALVGSQKQIDWASALRFAKINEIIALVDAKRAQVAAEKLAEFDARFGEVWEFVKGQTAASYWIDARETSAQNIVVAAAKATAK